MFGGYLKKLGILGMNSRNLDYIFAANPRREYQWVDDKLKTKQLCLENNIPTPELYATMHYQDQTKKLESYLEGRDDFVIKPAQGSGGGGIMVFDGRADGGYLKTGGQFVSLDTIEYHLSNILGGLYSLGGLGDHVIIEKRVRNIDLFEQMAYRGVPDIRLVVYKGVPAMAMLRLPTRASGGRANLHVGGIGVGLCLRTGRSLAQGVVHNRLTDTHVDTNFTLADIAIPEWDKILWMATQAGNMIKLGYIGVDIVMDKTHGPMLLEMNARPGISIQVANQEGLKRRLERIDDVLVAHNGMLLQNSADKIAFAREEFGIYTI